MKEDIRLKIIRMKKEISNNEKIGNVMILKNKMNIEYI